MAQTKEGALKARDTNYQKYGPDFYRTIGRMGGVKEVPKGFGSNGIGQDGLTGQERARLAGIVGGTKSRKNKRPVRPNLLSKLIGRKK